MADTIRIAAGPAEAGHYVESGRRVEDDPASIPFARLAEDCRRMSLLAQLESWLAALLADRAARR